MRVYATIYGQVVSSVKTFPAGELQVTIGNVRPVRTVHAASHAVIYAHIQDGNDIMAVLMLNDALVRNGFTVELNMPYVPYARQDRVCNPGESHSIRVFANLINGCNFTRVTVLDPHSDVTTALIDRVQAVTAADILKTHLPNGIKFKDTIIPWSEVTLLAPDAGALKRTYEVAQLLGVAGVVSANKKRNVATGHIEHVQLTSSVFGQHVLVVDDIIEGGGTFALLAPQLEDAASRSLYVTHGIFSKGTGPVSVYDNVYTTNSYHYDLKSANNITVFGV